ncbi:potassium transporter KefB [Methanocella sp. CWC-04]|uniref:Potassium transporter KefB n=2 Tax=Methanooceanicella nereidis TaxID=2052831 RepID=A0AAP2RF71_9EURY|nr:potassium transporter KefB [Methanocella sp. CWC-04]
MGITLLQGLITIFGLSIVILLICHRFRIPAIIGFLFTGILVGPYGTGIFSAVSEVEFLAEIGIVLLLFTIGIEFSFKSLLELKRSFFVGGTVQVLLTFLAAFAIASRMGFSTELSILIGFLFTLSSTAIVLRLLQEKDQLESPHGRTAVGILIFQDIVAVPMMLIVPLLAGTSGSVGMEDSIHILVLKIIGIILLVAIGTIWLVPKILFEVAKTRSRELFLLCIIVICLSMAWLTSSIGLSLALGAFLAGLIISESEYSQQALSGVLPFRDVFTSFFFVSIGMLLDIGFILKDPWTVVLVAIVIILLKSSIAGIATLVMQYPLRTAILVGFALSQVGEFSFIISKLGLDYGILNNEHYQFFLAASIMTMAATPLVMAASPHIANVICRLPIPDRLKADTCARPGAKEMGLKDHLIIIGYGLNGRNLARAAKSVNIPYTILEMNPETVKSEKEKGEPIFYGDGTNEEVLKHANINDARIVVVAISDPLATRAIADTCRRLNPAVHIIIRTRYIKEVKPLYKIGVNEVIPEEFETSVEIFARVLKKYMVPKDRIEKFITELRAENYDMFRSMSKYYTSLTALDLPLSAMEISTLQVSEGSEIAGKTLAQIEFRKKYRVTLLLIMRDSESIYNPQGDTCLYAGDRVVLFGEPENIIEISKLFRETG